MKESYMYILASHQNGTLYVGSTSTLVKRVWEHKNNIIRGVTCLAKLGRSYRPICDAR
ncbi:MAG: GIY-YIG nuclease family protein [Gammaproteobacteria bacterium]|nr:GIY-YIG nuclease family protein [Gammaproteobacteria bacterium]